VTAFSAAVIEEPCGAVLYSLNEDLRLPPASLTKMMTALLVSQSEDPARIIESQIDGFILSLETDSTVMGLKIGDQLSVTDLLHGLLLRSGNDAALTLAAAVAGNTSDFVDMMNAKADELGLIDTHFENPHGLDADSHYSTAHDMATLGREVLKDPLLAGIVNTRTYTPNWDRGYFDNINLLLTTYDGAIGVKTGYTDGAGQAIVGAAERNGRRLVISVMRSEDLYVDAGALLDWAFAGESACGAPAQATAPQ
jgi:serine-type D-Ala-D-Ala carboxypeptidase (penicillin-binding protein 5/6)